MADTAVRVIPFDAREEVSSCAAQCAKLRVTLSLARYTPHEAKGAYSESNFVLRLWHPCFRDFHYIRTEDLATARYTDTAVAMPVVEFNDPRPECIDVRGRLMVEEDASLGMSLYAQTKNEHGQDCVKYQGSYRHVRLSAFKGLKASGYRSTKTFVGVQFIDEVIESCTVDYPVRHTSTGVKADVGELTVSMIAINSGVVIVPVPVKLSADDFDANSKQKLASFVSEFSKFHNRVPLAADNLRQYFSLGYKVAPNVVLPASAYMLQVMDERSERVSDAVVMRLLQATIADHPEFLVTPREHAHNPRKPLQVWMDKCNEYLSCTTLCGPTAETSPGDVSFMDCLVVAMEVLSCQPNSEPYLLDMEVDTYARRKSAFKGARDSAVDLSSDGSVTNVVPVERFAASVMEGYGPDCEDDSMFEYKLKQDIQSQFLSSSNEALRTLARIYELFIAFGTHMKCKGDDRQTTVDDGVYHHALYMVPRMYAADCCTRGGHNPFKKRTVGSRAWESLYDMYLGVFVVEGTNTVCPAQFTFRDTLVEDIRNENATATCTAMNGVTDSNVGNLLRMYHSLVYAQPNQLSAFYRWCMGTFCDEGDDPLLLDYCFMGAYREKGVRVERLACMTDNVAISPIVKYTPAIMQLCKRILNLYRYPAKTIHDIDDSDALQHAHELEHFILTNKYIANMCGKNVPGTVVDRRRNYRVHVHHLDLASVHKERGQTIIKSLENIGRVGNAIAMRLNVHALGGTWCAAHDMRQTCDGVIHCMFKVSVIYFY